MSNKVVVLVRQDGLGSVAQTDRAFGREMFDRFLHSLESQSVKPHAICFFTEGVRLTCDGSPVLFSLRLIEKMGVRLVTCASCLEYYGLKGKIAAGEIGGMKEIVRLLMEADSVVSV